MAPGLQLTADMNKLLCPECIQMVPAQPKVDFLGFPKFQCPACMRVAKHPLSTARLVVYWLIAVASVAWSLKIIAGGDLPIMGILPALTVAAVVIDLSVRSHVNRARRRHDVLAA